MSLVRNSRFLLLLIVTAIVVFVAFMLTQEKASNKVEDFGKFAKELQTNVENVGTVVIQHKGQQFKIKKQNDIWAIVDKNDYPVAIDKIRDLVMKVADLEIIEKKTDAADNLTSLGLDDTNDEKSDAYRVMLLNTAETEVYADFVKGNERKSGNVSSASGIYVRKNTDNQAWLVRGGFEAGLDADTFLRPAGLKLKGNRIKEAEFNGSQPEGSFVLSRDSHEQDFKISKPEGSLSEDPNAINSLATLLNDSFVILDVRKQGDETSNAPAEHSGEATPSGSSYVIFRTFDGLEIKVEVVKDNGEDFVKISTTGSSDSTKVEADALNSVASRWLYKVDDKTLKLLNTSLPEIVKKDKQ